jgi:hypothetical protein
MIETGRFLRLAAIVVPLVIFTGCSGGGGGGGDGVDNPDPTGNTAQPLNAAGSDVPVVGELIADCNTIGVGIVDTVIDAVNDLVGDALPTALPTLTEILELANADEIPLIGGLVPGGNGMAPISLQDLLAQVPGGLDIGELPVLGQLPTVCAELAQVLPPGAIGDPAILLAALGDPAGALGAIAVLDQDGNPVGLLLASLPGGLMGGAAPGLPIGTEIPDLGELAPLDPADVPVLGSLVETLLGVLSGGGVGGLGGLVGLLGFLGLLL